MPALSFAKFIEKFVRVPEEASRKLVPLRTHPEQQRFVEAVDARQGGLRRHRPCFLRADPGVLPSGDVTCAHCPGWLGVKARYQLHVEQGNPRTDYRTFYQTHFEPNAFVAGRLWRQLSADGGVWGL